MPEIRGGMVKNWLSCLYRNLILSSSSLRGFKNQYPEIQKVGTINFVAHDVENDALNGDLLKTIKETAAITTLFFRQ